MSDVAEIANDAFDRMKRAYLRRTGCRLTAEMIDALSVTFLGEIWEQERPQSDTKSRGEAVA